MSDISESGIKLCQCENENVCTCKRTIKHLIKEERIIFELIDKIDEPEIKFQFLVELGEPDKPLAKENKMDYNYTNISNIFKKKRIQ